MAAATVIPDPVDQVETLLTCSICLEIFKEPRTLPCHHTFCKLCLTKFIEGQRKRADDGTSKKPLQRRVFHCPDCRAECPLKSNEEVEGMGSSHFIRNMLEVLTIQRQVKEKTTRCSRCHEPATCRCSTCVMFMCEKCHQVHESWPANKKHNVLSLNELSQPENQAQLKPKPFCKKHENKAMKFYCQSCQELICRYCLDFDHIRPDHLCYPLADVAKKEREVMGTQCQLLQQFFTNGHEALKSFSEIQESMKDNAKKAKEEILEHKKELIEMLEEKAKSLMNEVNAKCTEANEALSKQETEVKDYIDKVKGPLNLAKNLLENGNDEEILASQKVINEKVEELKNDRVSTPEGMKPVHDGHIEYENKKNEANDRIEKLKEMFGSVVVPSDCKLHKTSTILNKEPIEYAEKLQQWLGDQFQWRCCYQASRDGWSAQDFHRHCDGVGPTVTLVKVDDCMFGGYSDQDWAGNAYKHSTTSFLFSLRNKDRLPSFQAPVLNQGRNRGNNATCSNTGYGPAFGAGHDLHISGNSNVNQASYSNFGHTYQPPAGYVANNRQTRNLLAGSYQFTPSELEVFY